MRRALILVVSCGIAVVVWAQSAVKTSDIGAVASAPAASAPAAIDEAKVKDIRILLELTGTRQMAQELIDRTLAQMKRTLPNVPSEFWVGIAQVLNPQDLLDMMVPIYDRHFSHEDVKGLIAFYNSPVGKRLQAAQPAILRETHEVDQAWSQGVVSTILHRADQFRQYQLATQPASQPTTEPASETSCK